MKFSIILIAWVLCVPSAMAADPPVQGPITLDQAILLVLERSPLLKAADYEAHAAAARIRQARLRSPLRVRVDLEDFAGTDDASGSELLETTLSLSRVLELGNKPKLRGELASQEAGLLRNTQDARRLDLLAKVTRQYVNVVTLQERLVIAEDATALARRTLDVVKRRFKAGKTPAAERSRAVIGLAQAEIELEHVEHQLVVSRLRLAGLWGDTEPGFTAAQADLFALEPVAGFNNLERLLEQNPDLVRFATAQRLGEARYRLAAAGRQSNIEVSGGVRHLGELDDFAFVLSASMPLGSRQRAVPVMEEAQLLTLREPLAFEQRRLELYATLFEIHQELLHRRTAVETLRQRIIPEANRALRDYERGYNMGRYSFLELIDAQRELLNARLEAVTSAADYHRYRIEIDRLTGNRMTTGARQ